jgi:hypothetical protein
MTLRRVKIDPHRNLAPGWVAIVEDTGSQPYATDIVAYIAPPKCIDDAMLRAEAIVSAINAASQSSTEQSRG